MLPDMFSEWSFGGPSLFVHVIGSKSVSNCGHEEKICFPFQKLNLGFQFTGLLNTERINHT
jgi:hypothetical protein